MLETNIEEINNNENILYKAYMKLKENFQSITGIKVLLNKRIPMQAGMGGGSTDCASFILCMNKLFDLNLSKNEIINLGKSLGADVVPCLYNRAVIAEGIGDIITTINTNFKYYLVIVKPNISCNTREMYRKMDLEKPTVEFKKIDKMVKALENNNIELIADNLHNMFEHAIPQKSLINNIKKDFLSSGAIGSLMTGSGSCVYGIYKDKNEAKLSYKKLKQKYEAYICTSYNSKRGEMF